MQHNCEINIAAVVSYKIYPAHFGGQKGIALFYQYLATLTNVQLYTVKDNITDTSGIFMHHVLKSSFFKYVNIFAFFSIKKLVVAHKITHLIIDHPYLGWLGYLLKKYCGIALIIHSHNIEALRFKSTKKWWWKILWQYEKWVHQQADINFFITQEDLDYALTNYDINENRCFVITYGTELKEIPTASTKQIAKTEICAKHEIKYNEKILFFNGTLDYLPNQNAIDFIVHQLNSILKDFNSILYKIIICGKNLPAHYNNLSTYENVIYTGFVTDITTYFLGADVFLNPVVDGGGIKTKLVEALGYNLTTVSTKSGAIGVPQIIAGKKLIIVGDNDAKAFASAISGLNLNENTEAVFFNKFYWGNIAKKAFDIIRLTPTPTAKMQEKILPM